MQFSPFHDNLLATASSDGTVKVWVIPEGGEVKQTTTTADSDLKGHSKKVMLGQFNPCSEFTLASAGMEGHVRIWDIQNEQSQMCYDKLGGVPWCMQWNPLGNKIALINKEKKIHILDPRSPDQAMITQAHEGSKS